MSSAEDHRRLLRDYADAPPEFAVRDTGHHGIAAENRKHD
jgi:hypothetical protein